MPARNPATGFDDTPYRTGVTGPVTQNARDCFFFGNPRGHVSRRMGSARRRRQPANRP